MQNPQRWHVLLVEEAPERSVLLHHIIETLGSRQFMVTVSPSLTEAEGALGQRRYDAVMIGIALLGSPTRERIDSLRKSSSVRSRVIVTGVTADTTQLDAAREAGADAVLLTDAFEPRQVLAMLRELLAQG